MFGCSYGGGSGKSTLIKQILYPAIAKVLDKKYDNEGKYDSIGGDINTPKNIEIVDQNPIGRSSRLIQLLTQKPMMVLEKSLLKKVKKLTAKLNLLIFHLMLMAVVVMIVWERVLKSKCNLWLICF